MNDKQLFNIESDFLGLDFQNNFFKNPHDKYYSTVYKNYCELYVKYAYLSKKYSEIANSNIWKSTKKIRDFLDILKTFDNQRKSKIFNFIIRCAWMRRKNFYIPYMAFGVSKKEFFQQRKCLTNESIKFSILVPLYNTKPKFLKEMIGSVLGQSYTNWELCLADGSDENHKNVSEICEEIVSKDDRIKYKKLEKNLGISENTNACLKMATGDYISLFDHDDLLHPSALYETYRKINEDGAEFIYTDEAVFYSPNLHRIKSIHCKQDFSMNLLETNNYICHFVSFKKELLGDELFNSKCDGAQDFDIILRITEKTKKIAHIRKVLYYWRASPESTAFSTDAKTYTTESARVALENHFKRMKQNALVLSTGKPNVFFILYEDKNIKNAIPETSFSVEKKFVFHS